MLLVAVRCHVQYCHSGQEHPRGTEVVRRLSSDRLRICWLPFLLTLKLTKNFYFEISCSMSPDLKIAERVPNTEIVSRKLLMAWLHRRSHAGLDEEDGEDPTRRSNNGICPPQSSALDAVSLSFFLFFSLWKRSFVKASREITASECCGRMRMGGDCPHQETTAGDRVFEGLAQAKKKALDQDKNTQISMHLVFAKAIPKCVAAIHHWVSKFAFGCGVCLPFSCLNLLTSRWLGVSGWGGHGVSTRRLIETALSATCRVNLVESEATGGSGKSSFVKMPVCWDFLCWRRSKEKAKTLCLLEISYQEQENFSDKKWKKEAICKEGQRRIWLSFVRVCKGKKKVASQINGNHLPSLRLQTLKTSWLKELVVSI